MCWYAVTACFMFIGQVFCYYMTQSACGYRKQCAEIQLSSSKNNSSSFVSLSASALDSDSLQWSGEILSWGQMARNNTSGQALLGWVHVCWDTIILGCFDIILGSPEGLTAIDLTNGRPGTFPWLWLCLLNFDCGDKLKHQFLTPWSSGHKALVPVRLSQRSMNCFGKALAQRKSWGWWKGENRKQWSDAYTQVQLYHN